MIKSEISKKYACAYYEVFVSDSSLQQAQQYAGMGMFLQKHKELLFWLATGFVSSEEKHCCLAKLAHAFAVPEKAIIKLAHLLSSQSRLFLLDAVLHDILEVYKEKHRIMDVHITSSYSLGEEQAEQLLAFFKEKSGYTLQSTFEVDTSLIAGIRMKSNTLLWEQSIAKKMRLLRQALRQ